MKRAALAVLAPLAFAAPAHAAPDHQTLLSATATKFEWTGAEKVFTRGLPLFVEEARTAVPCKTEPLRPCEDVLIEIADAGRLSVKVEATADQTDVDVYLYESDASGAPGEHLATGGAAGADTVSAKVTPGFYLAQVDYYHALNGGYDGVATLSGATPPAAVAPPAVTAPPAAPAPAQPAKKKKASCRAKAKKVKNKRKRAKALKRCKKKKRG